MLFLSWMFLRAACLRSYVLVSGLYFVVNAHLSASQIVLLGTIIAVTLFLSNIPTGVWADTLGRRWSLVIGHLFLATGMTMTGVITTFPLLLVTQVLWGVGCAFLTGADIAWITDELDQPRQIARVLTASAICELAGGATGMIVFGMLGWGAGLATAIVVSGLSTGVLGFFVMALFTERNSRARREKRWKTSLSIIQFGTSLIRHDRELFPVFVAAMLINAAAITTWLFPKRLIHLGFSSNLALWYTIIEIGASATGIIALHFVQACIDRTSVVRRLYAFVCFVGVFGLLILAFAPNTLVGSAGVLLVSGVAINVTRTVNIIWVNQRTSSFVRATARSLLDQADSVGEICGGFVLALIVEAAGLSLTFLTAAILILCTGTMISLSRVTRTRPGSQ